MKQKIGQLSKSQEIPVTECVTHGCEYVVLILNQYIKSLNITVAMLRPWSCLKMTLVMKILELIWDSRGNLCHTWNLSAIDFN